MPILARLVPNQFIWCDHFLVPCGHQGLRVLQAVRLSLMLPSGSVMSERLATHAAGMDQQVPHEVALLPEGPSAVGARVGLCVLRVLLPVPGQAVLQAELLAAVCALVRLLFCVHLLVFDEITLLAEPFVAHLTGEGPRVSSLVRCHGVPVIACERAEGTLMLPWGTIGMGKAQVLVKVLWRGKGVPA